MTNPFLNLNDKELMLRYQNGDHLAFEALYLRHKDKVYTYLAKRLHDPEQLDDLFQKVFVKFHKARHKYEAKYDVLPWLYTITKNEFLDFLKKSKVHTTEFEEQLHTPVSPQDSANVFQIDLESESSLSEKEKSALKAKYLKEEDYQEISRLLNTSQSNARKLVSRAIQKLRKKYKGANS